MSSEIRDLEDLTEEERREALAVAEAARRAEEKAAERRRTAALSKLKLKQEKLKEEENDSKQKKNGMKKEDEEASGSNGGKIVFLSKRRREELAKQRQKEEEELQKKRRLEESNHEPRKKREQASSSKTKTGTDTKHQKNEKSHLTSAQLNAIKKSYLGKTSSDAPVSPVNPKAFTNKKNQKSKKKITFKFEWDETDDTSRDVDPLYDIHTKKLPANLLMLKNPTQNDPQRRTKSHKNQQLMMRDDSIATVQTVSTKPISKMTARDWRIFRENYDIMVRGGRAPPPLRRFEESPDGGKAIPPINASILKAIQNVLSYTEPSPIQRQAIPIGLQRRDLIGIAETGSGKTAAFGIPLCHYILSLPDAALDSVADNGPLALIMAPTRELALQINAEIEKLITFTSVRNLAVVGGQSIQSQASILRKGVHIVVGTPGRINDCVEMTYLVLNQCSYIVLDEADRMIDLGFAPQIEQILDSMGGLLKSSDETETYRQEMEDLKNLTTLRSVPKHRLTAMFSATMPPEVERIAKRYLRYPAVVSIGDRDTGKNTRIVQRVLYLASPSHKEQSLRDIIHKSRPDEKVIVFVNEKKHADYVGSIVSSAGRRCVVLHGGKTQDQREDSLDAFRRGGYVMVATDVAGRGLDIPNVGHIINYDLPLKIDSYCHRIGRTGRAGKDGYATSFITDGDESIMAPLKQYLENTGSAVPDKLARNPASVSGVPGGNIR